MALHVGTLVAELKLDDSHYNRGVDQGEKRFSKMGAFLGTTAKAIATAGGAAVAAAGAVGLSTAARMEQAEIAFTTMLGSGKKADRFLRDLSAFAAKTPFEFPELQTAASSLVSAGIEAKKVIPIMTTLGDVTSGMGTGSEGVKRATIALQQMNAAGRITGEDLNQLRDAGIPVYDLLASATGKSKAEVVKLAQAGKLGKSELAAMMKALESGKGLERFSGLMEKQSASLSGTWSTLKDTFSVGMAEAIQPIIPLLKDGMGGATALLAKTLPHVADGFQWAANAIDAFHEGLRGNAAGDTETDVMNRLARAGDWVNRTYSASKTVIAEFGAGWGKATDGVAYFGTSTERYGAVAHEWLWKIKAALHDVFPPDTDGGIDWAATLDQVQAKAAQLWPYLVQIADSMHGLSPIVTVLGGVFGFFAEHIDTIVTLMPLLVAAFVAYKAAQAASLVVSIAQLPITALLAASNFAHAAAINALLVAMGYERASRMASIVLWLRSTAATIGNTLAIGGLTVASWALTAVTKAITAGQWLWNAALTANPIGLVIVAVAAFVGALVLLYKKSETAREIMDALWSGIKTGVSAMWDFIRPIFATWVSVWLKVVGAIVDGAATMLGWMPGVGDKLKGVQAQFHSFADGVNAAFDGIKDEDIKVTAYGKLVLPKGFTERDAASFARRDAALARRATGGPISGSGSGTSDSIPALLSNGEHVWTAREVQKAGGHGAVAAMRAGIMRYATGGPVVQSVGQLAGLAGGARALRDGAAAYTGGLADATMRGIVSAVRAGYATSGAHGDPSPNGQGGLGPRAAAARQAVMAIFGITNIGGFVNRNIARTNVLSKHALGKAIDVMTNVYSARQNVARFFVANAAKYGVDNVIADRMIWNRPRGWHRYTGVSPHTDHAHIDFFDQGGVAEGRGLIAKNTSRPERVLSPRQTEAFEQWLAGSGEARMHRDDFDRLARVLNDRPVQLYIDSKLVLEQRNRSARDQLRTQQVP